MTQVFPFGRQNPFVLPLSCELTLAVAMSSGRGFPSVKPRPHSTTGSRDLMDFVDSFKLILLNFSDLCRSFPILNLFFDQSKR